GRRPDRAQGPPDDPAGRRRPRAADAVPHPDLGGAGAGQRLGRRPGRPRRALRGRDRGLAAAALGAARDRGAVGAPRQRAALGDAVAAGRRGAARARHVRAGDPGERQGARPAGGAGRAPGRRAGRAREGVHARAGAPGRQGDPPDDRRARQAREPGRRLRPRELRGAAAAFASAPPVGPLPSAVTAVKTTRGALFSVALPKRAGGYVWRIARPFNLRVARQASEADVGPTVVLAFRAVGRGRTAIVVAERRGETAKADRAVRYDVTVR